MDGVTDWGGEPERLEETDTGWTGQRDYKIDTRGVADAATALGLPQKGHAWGSGHRDLLVVRRVFQCIGGVRDAVADHLGWSWCRVMYETSAIEGSTAPPTAKFSKFKNDTESFVRAFDARHNNSLGLAFLEPPLDFPAHDAILRQINNGKGVKCDYGRTSMLISMPVNPNDVPIQRLIRLQRRQYINSDVVVAPPLLGSQRRWTFQPGELRYLAFELEHDRGLHRLIHHVECAPDFLHYWQVEDKDGNPVDGEPLQYNILYPAEPFQGLW